MACVASSDTSLLRGWFLIPQASRSACRCTVVETAWRIPAFNSLPSSSSLTQLFKQPICRIPTPCTQKLTNCHFLGKMSGRRSRSGLTEEQISELVLKLQAVLPEARLASSNGRVTSAAKVLQETCSYIRSLHREVDDLSERLSDLLATADISGAQAAVIRSFLM